MEKEYQAIYYKKHKKYIKERSKRKWLEQKENFQKNFLTIQPHRISNSSAKIKYKVAWFGHFQVLEHRWIMMKHLGRLLNSWEFVHHKNHNPQDNRIENLELSLSSSNHDIVSHLRTSLAILEKENKRLKGIIKQLSNNRPKTNGQRKNKKTTQGKRSASRR